MSKIANALSSLTKGDLEALYSIYLHRCLNEEQLYQLNFRYDKEKNVLSKELTRDKIKFYLELEVLEASYYGADLPVYFLTALGVNALKNFFDLPSEILQMDNNNLSVKRGFYRASELKISENYINHQKHLNDFVIAFTKRMNNRMIWRYYDEKYISQYSTIRPDGLIQLLDIDLLIEIDMNTESRKQLLEKWKNYRAFLHSNEYKYRERKIVMLFINYNTKKSEERKNMVKHSIGEILLDIIDVNFEAYVGNEDEIIDVIFKKLIPKSIHSDLVLREIEGSLINEHYFSTTVGNVFNFIINSDYDLYARKINGRRNIIIENKIPQHYLIDDYTWEPMSVINKITYFSKNSNIFKERFKLPIRYIIVVKNEESIYSDLKLFNLLGVKDVFFTTASRLKKMSFCEAVFTIDYIGNVYHFTEGGFQSRVFEKSLS